MPGRICKICADTRTLKRAAALIAEGLPDQKIADLLGLSGNAGRMLLSRHRRFHVLAPAAAIAEAAGKGRANVQEREQLVAAVEQGDIATAFLSLERIAADLRKVQERLERTAGAAEVDKQRLAVASLSGQQLRAAEVRAKLGGLGGYAPSRTVVNNAPPFVLNIHFSGGRRERIEATPFREEADAVLVMPASGPSVDNSTHGSVSDVSGPSQEPEDKAEFDEDV
jgi:hypothetical protein